jgi:hypothetical protein
MLRFAYLSTIKSTRLLAEITRVLFSGRTSGKRRLLLAACIAKNKFGRFTAYAERVTDLRSGDNGQSRRCQGRARGFDGFADRGYADAVARM